MIRSIYLIIRGSLAIGLFFAVRRIIWTQEDLFPLIKSAIFGVTLNAFLLICTSIAFLRPIGSLIFAIPFLEPISDDLIAGFNEATGVLRGRSLIGVSILSGAFLTTIWPTLLLFFGYDKFSPNWRRLLVFTSIMVPLAIVMTYSRGAILALLMVVLGVLMFYKGKSRNLLIGAVTFGVILFSTVGWDSEYFYFQRYQDRFTAMVENPYEDERESERILAYIEPWEHVLEHPLFFVLGQGFARNKARGHQLVEGYDKATHAVFAAAYYGYGLLVSFTYILLLYRAGMFTFKNILNNKNRYSFSYRYSRAIFASLLGCVPWFMLGHAAVSTPRGAYLLFFLFGLVAAQKNIRYMEWWQMSQTVQMPAQQANLVTN